MNFKKDYRKRLDGERIRSLKNLRSPKFISVERDSFALANYDEIHIPIAF